MHHIAGSTKPEAIIVCTFYLSFISELLLSMPNGACNRMKLKDPIAAAGCGKTFQEHESR